LEQPGVQADVWYSPALHKMCNKVPPGPRGGILAEEMGLGKTVEILALVLAMPAGPEVVSGVAAETPYGSLVQSRGTLVVCKVSLVGQWVTEAKSKLADKTLKIVEYHGSNR
jgi:SWI/SNF-related matrix-associated actin-dependent regulator of chromatin subfamily A3